MLVCPNYFLNTKPEAETLVNFLQQLRWKLITFFADVDEKKLIVGGKLFWIRIIPALTNLFPQSARPFLSL